MRQIVGLRWVKGLAGRPGFIPESRPRGVKALGKRFEDAVEGEIGGVRGQWFEFEDANGLGWCQTDFILRRGDLLVVLECKHTWTPDGFRQLHGLYLPVVERWSGREVLGIQVCKRLVPGDLGLIFGELEDAVRWAKLSSPKGRVVWHCVGGAHKRASGIGALPRPRPSAILAKGA
jgi:hypothetical protein